MPFNLQGACVNPIDEHELFLVYQRYPNPCDDASEFRRPVLPASTPIKPLKSGDKVGFHWSREDGIIWLYINGIKAGLFMSGLRGYEVYPAISFQLVNTAVRISFNLPVPPARTAPAKSEAEPSLIVPQ